MGTGAITQYVDVAQLVLYLFWAFFAGLIYYLVRENHREGYPMDSGRGDSSRISGWPVPAPKVFKLAGGHEVAAPDPKRAERELAAAPSHGWIGAPLVPTGDPMIDGVGPGSWALREDAPDRATDGGAVIRPLRALPGYSVSPKDTDPRGLEVRGADGVTGGRVTDIWLDRVEMIVRYLEVSVAAPGGVRSVLLPMPFARVKGGRDPHVKVASILGGQFGAAPTTKSADEVTKLEEDRIGAYYGGGTLYATPERSEPLA